jgi:sialic acid synthase SpsE
MPMMYILECVYVLVWKYIQERIMNKLEKVSRPLLVAEVGHNWVPFGYEYISKFIGYIKQAGWDIAKFQAYDTNKIKQPGDTNYEELKLAELSFSQLKDIRDICDLNKIEFAASAFDIERVEWLEKLGVKRHKIASRSIHDIALSTIMKATNKPIIASLGEWNGKGFPRELEYYKNITFLYCASRRNIIRSGFRHDIMGYWIKKGCGFSDHTIGNKYAKMALDLGAQVIEKHITLDKNAAGWDQPASADYHDMLEIAMYRDLI